MASVNFNFGSFQRIVTSTLFCIVTMGWHYVCMELRPLTGPLSIPQIYHELILNSSGMILTGKNRTQIKICPSTTFSIINSAWTDLGANPGLRGEKAGDLPPVSGHGVTSTLHAAQIGPCQFFRNISSYKVEPPLHDTASQSRRPQSKLSSHIYWRFDRQCEYYDDALDTLEVQHSTWSGSRWNDGLRDV
jgi:hypothetical protein